MDLQHANTPRTTYQIKRQLTTYVSTYEENHPGADVTTEELVFLKAVERFQHRARRRYPSWREILSILESLGYRKVCRAAELDLELIFPLEAALALEHKRNRTVPEEEAS